MTQSTHDLAALVRHYISYFRGKEKAELAFVRGQPNLEKAIEVAALCRTSRGKRHPHQTRIPAAVLSEARERLLQVQSGLSACRTFDALFRMIRETLTPVRGIGEATNYDIAQRIGAFLGLAPERVYLHAGTRKGAQALGLDYRYDALDPCELPAQLRVLEPYELEDFLCIYKQALHPPSKPAAGDVRALHPQRGETPTTRRKQ